MIVEYILWSSARPAVRVASVQPPRPSRTSLGQTIRELRHDRGLTIEELAASANLHPTYVSGIERGRNNPSWEKLQNLAAALGVRLSDIVLRAEALADEAQTGT